MSGTYTYNFQAAVDYAHQYVWNYNPNYVDNNPCGGDCTNYVSQAFYWGNQMPGDDWYRTWGTANCQGMPRWYGTNRWNLDESLRYWARHYGRGGARDAATKLGLGDIINYNWDGVGVTDHVTIVVDAATPLVNSHNMDRKNWHWKMGGAADYMFTRMYTTYTA